jgi:hypothetical protein
MQIARNRLDIQAGPSDGFTGVVYVDNVAASSGPSGSQSLAPFWRSPNGEPLTLFAVVRRRPRDGSRAQPKLEPASAAGSDITARWR